MLSSYAVLSGCAIPNALESKTIASIASNQILPSYLDLVTNVQNVVVLIYPLNGCR